MKRTFINFKEVPIIFGTEETEKIFNEWKEKLKISDEEAINVIKFLSLNPSSKLNLEENTSIEVSEVIKNTPVSLTGYDGNTHFVKIEVFGDVVEIKFHKPSEIWVKEGDILNKVELHKYSKAGKTGVNLYLIERDIERIICLNDKEGIFQYYNNYANITVVESSTGSKIEMHIRTKKESSNVEEEIFKKLNCEELENAILSANFDVFDVLEKIKTHGFDPKEFYRFKIHVVKTRKHEKIISTYQKESVFEIEEYNTRCTINLEAKRCYYISGDTSYSYDIVSGKETIKCKEGSTVDVEKIRSYVKELVSVISKIAE